MHRRSAAWLTGVLLLSACDIFHSTEWNSLCASDPGARECPSASGGGGSGGQGGGAGGSGGSGGTGGGFCAPGAVEACYAGPPGTEGAGSCTPGLRACNAAGTAFGPCDGEVLPALEQCASGVDEDCNGVTDDCVIARCADLPAGAPTGVYALDPDGAGPDVAVPILCDQQTDGGGWAMLLNSVGSPAGTTTAFWQIPYAERLGVKGSAALGQNFYAGLLYAYAKEMREEVADQNGATALAVKASFAGFDTVNMKFVDPTQVEGLENVFACHYAAGWSSKDFDNDTHISNCAVSYVDVTQHYCGCWSVNLGADANDPRLDEGWGPHVHSLSVAVPLGLATDGSSYTRVARVTRWARW